MASLVVTLDVDLNTPPFALQRPTGWRWVQRMPSGQGAGGVLEFLLCDDATGRIALCTAEGATAPSVPALGVLGAGFADGSRKLASVALSDDGPDADERRDAVRRKMAKSLSVSGLYGFCVALRVSCYQARTSWARRQRVRSSCSTSRVARGGGGMSMPLTPRLPRPYGCCRR